MQSDLEDSGTRSGDGTEGQIGAAPGGNAQDRATSRVSGFIVVRLSLGVLLLGAAFLKAYSLILSPERAISGQWLQIALVDFELLLAFWLVWGAYPRLLWLSAVATFFVFFEIALYRGLSGEESCGCLGHFTVSPWAMLLVDALALGSLLVCRPAIQNASRGAWFFPASQGASCRRFFVVCCSATAALLAVNALYRPASLGEDGVIDGGGQLVMLQPKEWRGKPFPLISHIDIGQELTKGRWFVLLRRSGCPQCEEMAAKFSEQARRWANDPEKPRFALIAIPPFDVSHQSTGNTKLLCATGKLTASKTWIVSTPVALFIEDGVVQKPRNPGYQALLAPGSRQHLGASDASDAGKGGFLSYAEIRRNELLRETACGPLSLIAVLDSLDVEVSAPEKERLTATAGDTGTTLLSLKEEAERLGIHAIGLELPPAALRRWNLPAIAHVNSMGFVAVTGYRRQGFEVVFPLQRRLTVSDDDFTKMFGETGNALLLSKSARVLGAVRSAHSRSFAVGRGPRLRLSQSVLSVGLIHDSAWTGTVKVYNDGTEPLHLSNITPSCTCMSAKLNRAQIPSKGSALLTVLGRQNSIGAFTYFMAIQTNDPDRPVLKVPVRGFLRPPAYFLTPFVTLGQVLTGDLASIDIPVVVAEPLAVENAHATIPGGAPLSVTGAHTRDGSPIVHLSWHGTERPGWYHHSIAVSIPSTDARVPHGSAALEVSVLVAPRIEAIPPSVLVNEREFSQDWQRRIKLQINDSSLYHRGLKPEFSWSNPRFSDAISVKCSDKDTHAFAINVSPSRPSSVRKIAGQAATLNIKWNDTASCQLRLFIGRNAFSSSEGL